MVVTPDGRHVGRLDAAFKYAPGIRLARIVQRTIEAIDVELVTGSDYAAEDERRLLRELRERLGDDIVIRITQVADLPLDRSGKLKFVVSSVSGAATGIDG